MTEEIYKRIDAASGEGAEFYFKDNKNLIGKFVITGTAGANIQIFEVRDERGRNCLYKAKCSNWNSATVELFLKTTHEDDDFSASGVIFAADSAELSEIR